MGLTKYIAPIAMAGAAFLSGPAGWAAYTMYAGAAIQAVGIATGSKDLQTAGMVVGVAGGVANIAGNMASTATTTAGDTTGSAMANAAPSVAEGGEDVSAAIPAAGTQDVSAAMANNAGLPAANGAPATADASGLNVAPVAPPPTVGTVDGSQFTNADGTGTMSGTSVNGVPTDPNMAAIAQLQKYSLISGALQGAGSAIGARTNADIMAQTQANTLAYQKSLSDRANSVGTAPSLAATQPTGLLTMAPVATPSVPHAL